jgi:hypothetical protein
MTLALLETLQEFCDRNGLDRPSVVMASQDDTIRQLRALANEVITDITNRGHSWAKFQKQGTFNTAAAELQTTIALAAPYGFKYVIPDSIWDRTERRPLFGPRNAPQWQQSEAINITGPLYSFRFWQGNVYMQPAPPAAHEIYFEYASDYSIQNGNGSAWKKRFTEDTDVFSLDEDLLLYGLQWKWRRRQGLSYAQEKQDYESLLAQAIGTSEQKGEVNMAGTDTNTIRPGIWVSSGSWPVSN